MSPRCLIPTICITLAMLIAFLPEIMSGNALTQTEDEVRFINTKDFPAAVYEIESGDLRGLRSGNSHPYHHVMWTNLREETDVFGVTNHISAFEVAVNPWTSEAAAVIVESHSSRTWRLRLNATYDQDMVVRYRTVIHELMHLLTVDLFNVHRNYNCIRVDPRMSTNQRYLIPFEKRFWTGCTDFFIKHSILRQAFVSQYASASILEDAAESGTAFIICGENHKHKGIAKEKIDFFAQSPEMQRIRRDLKKLYSSDFWQRVQKEHVVICDPEVARKRTMTPFEHLLEFFTSN